MKRNITQERLLSLLHYDPISGHFTRLVDGTHTKAGERAGYVKSSGYREIYISGDLYYEHRLAFLYMTGSFPEHQADHINHIKDDNRWCNLRPATSTENNRNTGIRKDNKSGFTGVCWSKGNKKWMVTCHANGKTMFLGYFEDLQDAAAASASARQQYHGAFATNSSQTITT